jgi:hypothetical protein
MSSLLEKNRAKRRVFPKLFEANYDSCRIKMFKTFAVKLQLH